MTLPAAPPRANDPGTSGSPLSSSGAVPSGARILTALAASDGRRLLRHPAVLAGSAAAACFIVVRSGDVATVWWVWDVRIGTFLLLPAGLLFLATHLAAGRVRRDGMDALYASFPVSTSRRTAAQLVSVLADVAACAVLTGVAVAWLDAGDAVGSPRPTVLFAGLAVVCLAGVLGVFLGRWLPHPAVGLLLLLVLAVAQLDFVLPFYDQPVRVSQGVLWMMPWTAQGASTSLPGPLANYPPAGAHLLELCALVALFAAASFRFAGRRRVIAVCTTGALGLSAFGASVALQNQPVSTSALRGLLLAESNPSRHESCTTAAGARFCSYPAFAPWVHVWSVPVVGVLDRLPKSARRPLAVYQVSDAYLPDLVAGLSYQRGLRSEERDLSRFLGAQPVDATLVPGASDPPVYVGLTWGRGSQLGATQLNLSLLTARWAVGLPNTGHMTRSSYGVQEVSCLPVNQARETVALWLAADATPQTRATFLAQLTQGDREHETVVPGGAVTTVWFGSTSYDAVPLSDNYTAYAAKLAGAMLALPEARVQAILAGHWATWTSARTPVDALAAALGVSLSGFHLTPAPAQVTTPGVLRVPTLVTPVCR